jgi:hypothetical protein
MKILLGMAFLFGVFVFLLISPLHDPHYVIQVIDTDQRDGRVVHQYVRVDMTSGTMCSLAGELEVNDVAIQSCDPRYKSPAGDADGVK